MGWQPLGQLSLALNAAQGSPLTSGCCPAGPVSGVSSKEMSSTLKKVLGPAAVAVAGRCAWRHQRATVARDLNSNAPLTVGASHCQCLVGGPSRARQLDCQAARA